MKKVWLAVMVLAGASVVSAQSTTLDADTQARITAASLGAATGSGSASTVKAAPSLSLESSRDDKLIRGQIGLQYGRLTFAVGAKTAASKDSDPSTTTLLADLDGLRSKTTGEVSLYVSHWIGDSGDPAMALAAPCDEYKDATGKKEGTDFHCRLGWFEKDGSAAGKRAYAEILDALAPPTIMFFGVNGSLAPENFKFVDKAELKDAQEKHTSWSVSGVLGVALKTNTVFAGSYKRAVAYKAKDKAQVCSPAGPAGSSTCVEKVVGAPGNPEKSTVVSFEAKQFFGANFAVAPKINHDFTNSVTGIEIPIYVLQDKNGGLTGGITLGWRSDKKEFTASAFVGPLLRLISKS